MRIDLSRLPTGELLIALILAATVVTFAAAFSLRGGGVLGEGAGSEGETAGTPVERGLQLATSNGCLSCHTTTGEVIIAPSWKGLFGKEETLADGSTVTVDEAYIQESIRNPPAKVVQGFSPVMPFFTGLNDEEIGDIIAYIQSLQ